MTEKQAQPDQALNFAVEEYKALWDYYKKTLEEREITLNYYFRTVTIPSAVLAIILFSKLRNTADGDQKLALDVDAATVAPILVVIFLVGVACLFKYRLEAENSRDFIRAINAIRKIFIEEFPRLVPHLLFARPYRPFPLHLSIPFYGCAIIALINSAILTAYIQFAFPTGVAYVTITFLFILTLQILISEGLSHLRRERHPIGDSSFRQ